MPSGTIRTALLFGLALVVLILAAAFFAPRLIDVRGLAPTIAAEMSRALGQPVRVRGDIFLSLVPAPRLIAKDLESLPADGGKLGLSAEEARADLRWADLLLGRYTISKLSLVRPTIDMQWRDLGALSGGIPRLSVERGRLNVLGLPQPLEIEALDADLIPAANGTLSWTLSGLADGLAVEISGKAANPSRTGARNLQATLKLPEADVSLDMSGVLSPDGAGHAFAGKAVIAALHAADVQAVTNVLDINPARWPWAKQPLNITAQMTANADRISLENGEIRLADQTATFSGSVVFGATPQFTFVGELGAVDVAQWLPAALAQSQDAQAQILDRMFTSGAVWRGEIKINGSNLRLGAQSIRDVAFDARRENAQWNIRNAALTLPGQTRLTFAGLWNAANGGLEGSWRANSTDPRGLLDWLSVEHKKVPEGRLSSFSASGTVQANDKLTVLSDLSVAVDATQATGRVSFGWDDATPIMLHLDIDRLAFEAYGPMLGRVVTQAPANAGAPSAGYGVNPMAPWLSRLATQRGNLRIAVEQLTWADALAGKLGLDVAFGDGVADIRSLAFEDSSGAALWLGGKIKNLGGLPAAESLQFDLKVTDVARFARSVRSEVPTPLRALSPWSLAGAVNGSLLDATVALDGKLGPITLKSRGLAGVVDGKGKFDATIDVAHPNASDLRDLMWGKAAFNSKINGAVAATAKLKIEESSVSVEEFKAGFGPNNLSLRAVFSKAGGMRTVKADVADIDLDWSTLTPWPLLPVPPPGAWKGEVTLAGSRLRSSHFDARDFSARYVAVKNVVELAEWRGKVFDGPAQVALKWAKEPDAATLDRLQHALQGQIVMNGGNPALLLAGLPVAPRGQADLTFNFAAKALAPDDWLAALSGSGEFRVVLPANTALKSAGVLAPLSAVVRAEVPDGRAATAMESSGNFTITKGIASFGTFGIRANAYTAAFTGAVDLGQQIFNLKGTLRLKDRGAIAGPSAQLVLPPTVPMTITGPIQAPTIKLDTSGAQR